MSRFTYTIVATETMAMFQMDFRASGPHAELNKNAPIELRQVKKGGN
jgi:hypothetical protein